MSDSIKLHPKYGANPTLDVCMVCQKETGSIVLLGASYDGEAPMRMVCGIEPCDACRKKYLTKGILLVEAEEKYQGNSDKKVKRPTGKFIIIKDSGFKRMFPTHQLPVGKIIMVEVGVLQKLNQQTHG